MEEKLPNEIAEKCAAFSDHLTKIERQLEIVAGIGIKERNAMDALDRAKIDLVSVYSINSLGWLYHIVNGSNPKDSQIPGELTRIQANMKKVKDIEDKKRRVSVDSKAAKRVVTHELHQFKKRQRRNSDNE